MGKKIDVKLEKVEIVLENCEVFTFSGQGIGIELGGIGKSVWGDKLEFDTAKYAKIVIAKDAKATGGWDNEKWQDRIHKDITQIHLTYTGGFSFGYHLDWDIEKSEYENAYETDTENENVKIYTIGSPRWRKLYE